MSWWVLIADIISILLSTGFVLYFLPLTTKTPFLKYSVPTLLFIFLWILLSLFFNRYNKRKKTTFFIEIFKLFYTTILVSAPFYLYILIEPHSAWSQYVLLLITIGIFVLLYFIDFFYFAYKYAIGIEYDTPNLTTQKRPKKELLSSSLLNEEAIKERKYRIIENKNKDVYQLLKKNINLNFDKTLIINDVKSFKLEDIKVSEYSTIVFLQRLNHIRGINKAFSIINNRLPDDSIFVCCYKSKSTIKKKIMNKNNRLWGLLIYISHFLYHRVMPKIFLTRRLYYDLTNGKKRILSKTEVLGRLTYCGFEPIRQIKVGDENYIICKRIRDSKPLINKNYGALIKLERKGKDGEMFYVYKFRTMHPYAEYIQDYIYRTNKLADGGKFNKDIRITSLGGWMRKYWVDELPMFLNLFKGQMKLIGVRPLSKHYFSLYSKELQEKRIKFKPGLLPPFYADMPTTLKEIQNSEMKYLTQCETKGVFKTDLKYFFIILNNILFKKVRSA